TAAPSTTLGVWLISVIVPSRRWSTTTRSMSTVSCGRACKRIVISSTPCWRISAARRPLDDRREPPEGRDRGGREDCFLDGGGEPGELLLHRPGVNRDRRGGEVEGCDGVVTRPHEDEDGHDLVAGQRAEPGLQP